MSSNGLIKPCKYFMKISLTVFEICSNITENVCMPLMIMAAIYTGYIMEYLCHFSSDPYDFCLKMFGLKWQTRFMNKYLTNYNQMLCKLRLTEPDIY